jgi:hypothetical protein
VFNALREQKETVQNSDVLQEMIIRLMEAETNGEAALLLLKLEDEG